MGLGLGLGLGLELGLELGLGFRLGVARTLTHTLAISAAANQRAIAASEVPAIAVALVAGALFAPPRRGREVGLVAHPMRGHGARNPRIPRALGRGHRPRARPG